jgi:hypothetical protein
VTRLLYRIRLYRQQAEWIDQVRGIDRVELEPDQDTESERVVLIIGEEEIEPIRRLMIDTSDGDHSKLLLDAFDDQVFFERARLEREANRPRILRLYIYKRYAPILDEIRGLHGEALEREERARVHKIVSRITYHLNDEEADHVIEALRRIEDEEAREHLLDAIRDERERDPRIRWLVDETPGLAEELVMQLSLDWFVRWATHLDPDTDQRAWDIARAAQHAIAETPTEVEAMRSERIGDPDKWPANTLRAATRVYTEEEGVAPVEALRRAGFLRG